MERLKLKPKIKQKKKAKIDSIEMTGIGGMINVEVEELNKEDEDE